VTRAEIDLTDLGTHFCMGANLAHLKVALTR